MKIGLTRVLALITSMFALLAVSCSGGGGGGGGGNETPATPTVIGIIIEGQKTTFDAGDIFEVGNTFKVKKTMSDNTTDVVASGDYTVTLKNSSNTEWDKTVPLVADGYTVEVKLNGTDFSQTYTITVNAIVLTPVLDSIAITAEPDNSGKFVGDTLNTTGLVITATYTNGGEPRTLDATSEGVTIEPTTLSSTSNTITVTYNDGTTTKSTIFTVDATAVEVVSINVTTNPKTSYMGSDKTISLDGMVVTATKNNGKTKVLEETEYTTNVSELSFGDTDGTQELVVKLVANETITDSVTLYYSADTLTLDSIAIKSEPTTKTYFVGDTLDITDLVITATYNKSSGGTITRDITPTLSDVNVDMTTAGTKTATVSYTDGETKTATFEVTVTAITLSSISIATEPTKKDYIVGDTVELTGIVVNAVYNDTRKNKTLGASDVSTTTTLNTAGDTVAVTVSYTDDYGTATASYNVAVADKPTFTVTVAGDKDISIIKTGNVLTAELNGITGTSTYQWSVDGTNVSTTNTYTPAALASGEVRIVTLIVTVDGTKYSANITIKN